MPDDPLDVLERRLDTALKELNLWFPLATKLKEENDALRTQLAALEEVEKAARLMREARMSRWSESERLDWLEKHNQNRKWDDFDELLRPRDEDGWPLAKYVGENGWTIRAAIDAAMLREKGGEGGG